MATAVKDIHGNKLFLLKTIAKDDERYFVKREVLKRCFAGEKSMNPLSFMLYRRNLAGNVYQVCTVRPPYLFSDGQLVLGCHIFDAAAAKQIIKWAKARKVR